MDIQLNRLKVAFLSLCLFVITGCSSTSGQKHIDPFEPVNRSLWTFTWDYADKYVAKPASAAYVEYVHPDLRSGILNMALNLNEPSTIINNLLQAKFTEAAKSTGRFLLNSTIGLLGFFDPASDFGWARQQEEFGEVLGKYGVPNGPYLVMPAMGPSSVREEVGDWVDRYYWPLALLDTWSNLFRIGIVALEQRALLTQQEKLIEESLDPYEFVKNAYFQNVEFRVHDGNPPIEVNEEDEAELEAFLDEMD